MHDILKSLMSLKGNSNTQFHFGRFHIAGKEMNDIEWMEYNLTTKIKIVLWLR